MEQSIGQFNFQPGPQPLLLAHVHPLLEQLGSSLGLDGLEATSEVLLCPRVDNLETLGVFLEAYQDQLLYPVELPAIFRAHYHASRHQTRELIALDRHILSQPVREDFLRASRRAGQRQLERLRPLRDQRLIQRYLEAVDRGQANAWHTLVFGLILAVYSLPVRQGLMNYTRQTLRSFLRAGARKLNLSDAECEELLEMQCSDLPRQLDRIVRASPTVDLV